LCYQQQAIIRERNHINKLDLIQAICTTNDHSKVKASRIVNLFFEQMATALEKGERVEIRGLCSFYVKGYECYTGRNPKTGERVEVVSKKLPFFKCGKGLKERVNK